MNGIIIQARTKSTRLPAKVLLDLPFGSGVTILEQIIRRAFQAKSIDAIVIATSCNSADDIIANLAKSLDVECYRGSEINVLERYYVCAQKYKFSNIVRLCGDSPFIDGDIIDQYLHIHKSNQNDYTGTRLFPLGTNTEIFTYSALEAAYINATESNEKEHVTPYIRNNKDLFKISFYEADEHFKYPSMRLTIDTSEDYALACAVYDYLYLKNPLFKLSDVVELFTEKPWLSKINEKVAQKKILTSLQEELNELTQIAKMQDLLRAANFIEQTLSHELK
jgi:spore coat polysaccharide biosynthesis protein SpsF